MGRLEDIVERNRNPRAAIRKSGRRGIGLAGVVLFVALILFLFTDLADSPKSSTPPTPAPTTKPDRLRGVRLGAPAPAPKPGSGSVSAPAPVPAQR